MPVHNTVPEKNTWAKFFSNITSSLGYEGTKQFAVKKPVTTLTSRSFLFHNLEYVVKPFVAESNINSFTQGFADLKVVSKSAPIYSKFSETPFGKVITSISPWKLLNPAKYLEAGLNFAKFNLSVIPDVIFPPIFADSKDSSWLAKLTKGILVVPINLIGAVVTPLAYIEYMPPIKTLVDKFQPTAKEARSSVGITDDEQKTNTEDRSMKKGTKSILSKLMENGKRTLRSLVGKGVSSEADGEVNGMTDNIDSLKINENTITATTTMEAIDEDFAKHGITINPLKGNIDREHVRGVYEEIKCSGSNLM